MRARATQDDQDTAPHRCATWWGSPIDNSTTGRAPVSSGRRCRSAQGSGTQRRYSFTDIVQLKVVKRLLDAGMSLKKIRSAMEILREQLAER